MAEIRINATGGVKLYDADDSHYAQIVAGTITSNVDAITLGHNIATFNAAVTAGGVLKTDDTTEATSTTDGSLQTDGGLSVAKDTVLGDDLKLLSDSSVIAFGADGDTTLTHTDGTGLTLNSTNKLCFNDASQYIQGASNAILDIAATDEIELTATLVDVNANLDVSGTYTGAGLMTTGGNIVIPNAGNIGSASDTDAIAIASNGVTTFSQAPVFPDGSLALADLDIDGGTDIGAAIVDADLFIVDDGAGGTNRKTAASRLKTYVGGGITVADDWKVTASFTGDANPISANLSQTNHAAQGQMGSAMTVSSGVWTFPSTGFWLVTARASSTIDIADGANTYDMIYIGVSTNAGVSWSNCAHAGQGVFNTVAANNTRSGWVVSTILDVTNTTNNLVRFQFDTLNDDREIYAPGGSETDTGFTFIRLGDT